MNPELIRRMAQQGETLDIEFKGESREPLNDKDIVKAVTCLANWRGTGPAWLLVGVEDDGTISGALPRHDGHTNTAKVAGLISDNTTPSVSAEVHDVQIGEKRVLAIEIPTMSEIVGTKGGAFFMRTQASDGKPVCRPMTHADMVSLRATRGYLDPTAQIAASATWDDLDPVEFARFRNYVREYPRTADQSLLKLPDLELAKALRVVNANGAPREIRIAALLLFGTEDALADAVPNHSVAFQVLRRNDVEVNDFFRWPLLKVLDQCGMRFRARILEEELLVGFKRVGVPNYSYTGLREALSNAMMHRDYLQLGEIYFQWHDDKVNVSNPGGFPVGVDPDNLVGTTPRPRNPLLADAFKRAGIAERTGRGIDMIIEDHLRTGRGIPSYANSNAHLVTLEFPGGKPNLDFVRVIAEKGQEGREFSLSDLLILNRIWNSKGISILETARLTNKSESEVHNILGRLSEYGLVDKVAQGGKTNWLLSNSVQRTLGSGTSLVSAQKPDELVLQYVSAHGRITRGEAAELCRIDPVHARRVLARLVKSHQLILRGTKRGAFYEAAPF